jgi:hypothetical protein
MASKRASLFHIAIESFVVDAGIGLGGVEMLMPGPGITKATFEVLLEANARLIYVGLRFSLYYRFGLAHLKTFAILVSGF